IYISGTIVLPRWRNNLNVNSRLMMTLLVAASLAVRSPLAWAFLALVAANALAAMTMRRLILGFAAAAPLIAIALWPHWLIGLGDREQPLVPRTRRDEEPVRPSGAGEARHAPDRLERAGVGRARTRRRARRSPRHAPRSARRNRRFAPGAADVAANHRARRRG